jgi:hypothetical protein
MQARTDLREGRIQEAIQARWTLAGVIATAKARAVWLSKTWIL